VFGYMARLLYAEKSGLSSVFTLAPSFLFH